MTRRNPASSHPTITMVRSSWERREAGVNPPPRIGQPRCASAEYRTRSDGMSIHAMSWVLRNSEAKLGQRLVLLVLADHAKEDGTKAWPCVETIMREARMSRRAVQMALRGLEEDRAIVREGTSRTGSVIWAVVMEGGAVSAPLPNEGGAHPAPGGAHFTTEGGADLAPESSLEQPSIEPSSRRTARAGATVVVTRRNRKVDRKLVSEDEDDLARRVLARWNELAGQSLSKQGWIDKIIMRIREQPDLDEDDHAAVIAAALANPWWSGAASPSVVYGSDTQFEKSQVEARLGPRRRRPRTKLEEDFDRLIGGEA